MFISPLQVQVYICDHVVGKITLLFVLAFLTNSNDTVLWVKSRRGEVRVEVSRYMTDGLRGQ